MDLSTTTTIKTWKDEKKAARRIINRARFSTNTPLTAAKRNNLRITLYTHPCSSRDTPTHVKRSGCVSISAYLFHHYGQECQVASSQQRPVPAYLLSFPSGQLLCQPRKPRNGPSDEPKHGSRAEENSDQASAAFEASNVQKMLDHTSSGTHHGSGN